jgi:zinc protease
MVAFMFQEPIMMQNGISRLSILAMMIHLWCASAPAQTSAPLPELSSKRLLNDLQITVASTPNLGDSMAIGLVVRYGAAFDPTEPEKGGLANLVSRMMMKATSDKTLKDVQNELSYLEAAIDVQCNWDGFRFLLKGQSSKFERSLLLLYQVVAEAQFNEADFTAVKQAILEELQRPPDPRRRIHSQFENVLFSGTTYGRPLEGTVSSVSAITLGDVRYFYHRYFSPSQASLQIVGNVSASDVLQKASRIWGIWVRKDDIPFTFLPPRQPAGRRILLEDDPNSPAAQFIIGSFFPRRQDPVYVNVLLAVQILQERLTKLLPTSLVTAGGEGRRMESPFYIQGQAAAEQAIDEIRKIQDAVKEMKSASVSDEELAMAQKAMIDEFNRRLSSTDGLCNIMLDSELYRLGSNYAAAFPDRVRRCNVDAIRQAANEWLLPGGEVLLIRGPAVILTPELRSMGMVQKLIP